MAEVKGMLIALGAMLVGLLVISWAYGDFRNSKGSSRADGEKPAGS